MEQRQVEPRYGQNVGEESEIFGRNCSANGEVIRATPCVLPERLPQQQNAHLLSQMPPINTDMY